LKLTRQLLLVILRLLEPKQLLYCLLYLCPLCWCISSNSAANTI